MLLTFSSTNAFCMIDDFDVSKNTSFSFRYIHVDIYMIMYTVYMYMVNADNAVNAT